MCGIVGYVGKKNSIDILIETLKNLEYRGYDSSGIAVLHENNIKVVKCVGVINNLKEKLKDFKINSTCGIGHTRWATHGVPSNVNSHPHSGKNVSLVHNGIIENYAEIKEELSKYNINIVSDTDTEVVAKLLDFYYECERDEIKAIKMMLKRVVGSYAFGIVFKDIPDKIFAVRKDSPLIVGVGNKENFIASDISAILKYTKDYYLLDDNEIVTLEKNAITIQNIQGELITKQLLTANWNVEAAEKNGYKHFMLKEIHEQPEAIKRTISPRIKDNLPNFDIDVLNLKNLSEFDTIHIVACGTAMHAGLVGKTLIETLSKVRVNVEIASEFRYKNPILNKNDLVIAISQSGETADTLAAVKLAKSKNIHTLAIVNVIGSSIARLADSVLYTFAGPEISVASTKAYSVQVSILYLLAFQLSLAKNVLKKDEVKELVNELKSLPKYIKTILNNYEYIKNIAKDIMNENNIFYIGRNLDYSLAQESSLKLKEISYIHSEAYAAGELKHGTISLIENNVPVIAISTQDFLYEKTISNIKEVKSRGAKIIFICKENVSVKKDISDFTITIPVVKDIFTPLLTIIPTQLLAYFVSDLKNLNVDKPRNLAKSVTVE